MPKECAVHQSEGSQAEALTLCNIMSMSTPQFELYSASVTARYLCTSVHTALLQDQAIAHIDSLSDTRNPLGPLVCQMPVHKSRIPAVSCLNTSR